MIYSTEPAAAFHDIKLGSNGLYPAGPGYDLDTGLGTPDIASWSPAADGRRRGGPSVQ